MKLPSAVCNLPRYLPAGLEGLLVVLLLWQLAGLFWQVLTPSVQHGNLAMPLSAPAVSARSTQSLQDWFAAPQATVAPVTDLQLLAVVTGQCGVAVLRAPQASTVAVRLGEEIRPGSRLVGITASGVEIESHGQRHLLALPSKTASQASALVVAVPSAPKPAVQNRSLTRGQLSGLLRSGNLADWSRGLSSYRDGGILIDDPASQPLLSALQLRAGDVLKRVNGKAINQLSDISLLYNQLSQQSSVELSVLRDGSLQTLHYKIQP